MEKTPDYVKGKERDPRNDPSKEEAQTEAKNRKLSRQTRQREG